MRIARRIAGRTLIVLAMAAYSFGLLLVIGATAGSHG